MRLRALVDVHASPLLALGQTLRQFGVTRRCLPQGTADPRRALVNLTDQPRRGTRSRGERPPTERGELRPFSERDRLDVAHHRHIDRGEQQVCLRPEVRIHRLHRHAREASDVSHPGTRPPVLAEEPDGSVEHCRPCLRRVLQTTRRFVATTSPARDRRLLDFGLLDFGLLDFGLLDFGLLEFGLPRSHSPRLEQVCSEYKFVLAVQVSGANRPVARWMSGVRRGSAVPPTLR